jgi:ribonuclease BN (tRNA processing enzyme)
MKLVVLGSNGTYPTLGRPASGYLVEAGETAVLLDCGPGVFPHLLARDRLPDGIVLSHVHGDHCLDLLPLFNHVRFDRPDLRGIPLLAPEGVVDRLAAFAGADPDHAFFSVFAPQVVGPDDVLDVARLTLRFGEAVHPVPAVVTRVDDGERSLTYSGDTGPGGDLEAIATGSDVLVCEATLQGVPGEDRYPYHLFASEAGAIARAAGTSRLVVTHVAPSLDPARSAAEAASEFDGPVELAEPGMEIQW